MTNIAQRALQLATLTLVCLAAIATSASAVTGVQISPGGAVEAFSLGKVTFRAGTVSIKCKLTVTGELLRALQRIEGEATLLGSATGIRWSECEGGEVESVLGLPWEGFLTRLLTREAGGLCNVAHTPAEAPREGLCGGLGTTTEIAFKLSTFGGFIRCLYGGPTASIGGLAPLRAVEGRPNQYTVGLATAQANNIRLVSGAGCPSTGEFIGMGIDPTFSQTVTFL